MGLTIRKVRDEGKTAENFYSHMTAIQNLYDEARRILYIEEYGV